MKNITRFLAEKRLFSGSTDNSEKKVMLRPKKKAVDRMLDLLSKICTAGKLVLVIYIGTLATTEACSQLFYHRRLAACEKDSACFQCAL